MNRFILVLYAAFVFGLFCTLAGCSQMVEPPGAYGVVASERQLSWHELEFYGFVHFGINTFTDKEWGYGDESPALFDPTAFDAEQIAGAFADAGMKGLVLTCKHHDGFCLWPSKFTEYDIAASPWKDGKGDMVAEFAAACRRNGIKFGVYLSPWDRHHSQYGRSEYVTYYRNQLEELLSGYGPVFEVWWDGANGGDGFYGGARETRRIDRSNYYEWEKATGIVRRLQPEAVIFSDAGDLRWVGNERGVAGVDCWATYTPRPREGETVVGPGTTRYWEGETGHRDGKYWMPAECDVSIRPGWFYHAAEDDKVKTPEELFELYFASVGRGASFMLNVPPDRRGLVRENDVAALRGLRRLLDATFDKNLAAGATAIATNTRDQSRTFAAANVLDGDRNTYWSTDDGVTTPELILELPRPITFNVVSLREYLPLGQRVTSWGLDAWGDGGWDEFATGKAIGSRRLWRGDPVTTDKVRLRITEAPVCPAICEFALHCEISHWVTEQLSGEVERIEGRDTLKSTVGDDGHTHLRE